MFFSEKEHWSSAQQESDAIFGFAEGKTILDR